MSGITVAVTGGSGFIGSRIIADLVSRGYTVNALVRNKNKVEGLTKLGSHVHIFEIADLINEDLSPAFNGAKYVIHAAAPVVFVSNDPENEVIKPAIGLTQNVLKHALQAGIKRVVITSTMATMCGEQRAANPDHVWTEEDWNENPGSGYSKAKTLSERGAWEFVKAHPELEIVTIHPALVLGPVTIGQSISTVEAVADILKNKYKESGYPPRLTGIVDVRDVSLAHLLALDNPAAANQRYILALPDQYSFLEVAQSIKNQFPEVDVVLKEQQATNPKKNGTNNQKVQKQLGLTFRTFDDTVKDTVLSLKEHGLAHL